MDFDPNNNYQDKEEEYIQEEKKPIAKPTIIHEQDEDDDNDNDIEREKLIILLNRYKNSTRFGTFLIKEMKLTELNNLEKLNKKKLENLLDRVKININNKQGGDLTNILIMGGISSIEKLLTSFEIVNLTGLTQSIQNNNAFLDALEEVIIEYNINFNFKDPNKDISARVYKSSIYNSYYKYIESINKY